MSPSIGFRGNAVQKIPCYMCGEKTNGSVVIKVTTPNGRDVLGSSVPLCANCIVALERGSLYLELHKLVEAEPKRAYSH